MLRNIDTAASFKKTLDFALAQHPDTKLVLLTGDLAEQPVPASYQHLAEILNHYPLHFYCLPGNHDDYSVMLKIFNQPALNCNKQLLLENWQILMLNSQIPGATGGNLAVAELEFVKRCLIQQAHRHTVIAVHHHCVSTDSQWMDTMLIKNSTEFLELLQQHPQTKAVIIGHIHQELEQQTGNIQILGTPSTCFQFKPLSDTFALGDNIPGYRWLELHSDGGLISGVDYLPESV